MPSGSLGRTNVKNAALIDRTRQNFRSNDARATALMPPNRISGSESLDR
ncbi:MAG: hypothetical protein KME27_30540 [Lyngbya sp. HA4199-MV5]|nr:hypothetical protein [Lyngbya sp. HA4199-MV5]